MSDASRNYLRDFDYRVFSHTASASQFATFASCPRKWWFGKVARLPEVEQEAAHFAFGNRLHEACERFLLADDTGRGPDGKPVDLWPDGWDRELSAADAALMRRLVEKGIEEGVLVRSPQRRVEAPVGRLSPNGTGQFIPRQVVPGVGVCGYRDVAAPGLVVDHKSSSSTTYLKSRAALTQDPQMMLYAAIDLIECMEETGKLRERVTLRHNQFVKSPKRPKVKFTEVEVTADEIQTYWEEKLEPDARDMLRYKQNVKDADSWNEIEGPREKGICRAYGGCPFAGICGKTETPDAYRARIKRLNEAPKPVTHQESMMGIFDRINSEKSAAEPATLPATPPAETQATEELIPETSSDVPPWANADCTVCKGTGFNKKNKPCAACDRVAEKVGAPRVANFELGVDDEGYVTWTRTADGAVLGRVMLAGATVEASESTAPITDEQREKAKAAAPKAAPKAAKPAKSAFDRLNAVAAQDVEPKPEPAKAEAPASKPEPAKAEAPKATKAKTKTVEPDTDKSKGKRGRPATGFLMVYGSIRRAQMKVVDLNEVFHAYARELAEAMGVGSYYDLDRFKRRDLMASKAADIAATFASSTIVVVRSDDPDLRPFATALEPFASNVIEGLS